MCLQCFLSTFFLIFWGSEHQALLRIKPTLIKIGFAWLDLASILVILQLSSRPHPPIHCNISLLEPE